MIFSADSYSSSPSGWGWREFFSGEGGCGSVQVGEKGDCLEDSFLRQMDNFG